MARGCIDIYRSRRDCFDKCYYWTRNEDDNRDLDEYKYSKDYVGFFYAKETTANYMNKNILGGMFLFDANIISIMTNDCIDIKSGDIVLYGDKTWKVDNVQKMEVHKNNDFMKVISYKTYLQLKR